MINKARLEHNAAGYGIALTETQLAQLDIYAEQLVLWNEKMNLTAITETLAMENRHFIDSLVLAAQPELGADMADVGSGAGFPGMVAKLNCPQMAVTLIEPTGKRLRFLQALADTLSLPVTLVKERAEEAARKAWRERALFVSERRS